MNFIALFSAFGIGSVVTALVQALVASKSKHSDRKFAEKKEAFVGILEAYHRAAVEGTDAAAKDFAYWQMRCELVASRVVRDAIEDIVRTNEDPVRRQLAHEELKDALRRDLGVRGRSDRRTRGGS